MAVSIARSPVPCPRFTRLGCLGALLLSVATGLGGFAGSARADDAAMHYNLGLQLKRDGKLP